MLETIVCGLIFVGVLAAQIILINKDIKETKTTTDEPHWLGYTRHKRRKAR